MKTILAPAVLLLVAGAAGAQDLAYKPGKFQYRVDTELHQKQEMMGQSQEMQVKSAQHVSLAVTGKGKDTLGFQITVDSATADQPMAQQQMQKIIGKTASGTLTPRGRVIDFSVPGDSAANEAAEFEGLKNFLVYLPANAKKGTSVVDTLNHTFSAQGMAITQEIVMTSIVAGDTTINGEKAVVLERTGTMKMSGEGEQGGQQLILDGTGTMGGKMFVSHKGSLIGGHMDNSAQLTVQVPAVGAKVPISQKTSSTVSRVPAK